MSRDPEGLLAAASRAVQQAAGVCRRVQRGLVDAEVLQKGDRSPATVADFASQAVIRRLLVLEAPEIPLVGEEEATELEGPQAATVRARVLEHLREVWPEAGEEELLESLRLEPGALGSGTFWVVDPIDGTKGFLRGGHYAVALALLQEGRPVLGLLACPEMDAPGGERGLLVAAREGEGCRAAPLSQPSALEPVHTSEDRSLEEARMCESVERGHSAQEATAAVRRLLGARAAPVRMDSQAKYAAVACGLADAYLRLPTRAAYREKIWDHAAGALLVQEAGGVVTDARGRPLDFGLGTFLEAGCGVVATTRRLHDGVLDAVRRVLQGPGPGAETT